jgi:hypothetical protein
MHTSRYCAVPLVCSSWCGVNEPLDPLSSIACLIRFLRLHTLLFTRVDMDRFFDVLDQVELGVCRYSLVLLLLLRLHLLRYTATATTHCCYCYLLLLLHPTTIIRRLLPCDCYPPQALLYWCYNRHCHYYYSVCLLPSPGLDASFRMRSVSCETLVQMVALNIGSCHRYCVPCRTLPSHTLLCISCFFPDTATLPPLRPHSPSHPLPTATKPTWSVAPRPPHSSPQLPLLQSTLCGGGP